MDDGTRQAVRDRAKNYLGKDEVGVLNSIKTDIATYCGGDLESYYKEFQEQLQDLQKLIRARDNLKTERHSLEEERLKQGDSELEEKKTSLDHLKEQLKKCTERLQEIERSSHSKPSENTDCLKELDQLIKKAEDDVAEATNTLKLKRKTEIARKILFEAHQQAREELRKFIIEETNHRITQLLSRDPVWLEDIQDSLKLQGRGGASMGQTLSVSYAFLATLFNRSDYQLPFIVDSPAGALDLNVRPEVARLIPSLCNQFVAFTISSERQSFVDVLHQAASEQVQYLTLFRKTSRMNSLWQNIAPEQRAETLNGVIVKGQDFFNCFDLDEEV
jgi:DNA sulfur modification protein DndD